MEVAMSESPKTEVVKCPEPFAPFFAAAEDLMESFFYFLSLEDNGRIT